MKAWCLAGHEDRPFCARRVGQCEKMARPLRTASRRRCRLPIGASSPGSTPQIDERRQSSRVCGDVEGHRSGAHRGVVTVQGRDPEEGPT